jgi:hypothetical protein
VQFPPDIDGKLLGFGARKQHAETECMKEETVANPFFFVDQVVVHDCDMAGGASKADPSQLEPKAQCLSKRRPSCEGIIFHPFCFFCNTIFSSFSQSDVFLNFKTNQSDKPCP